MRLIISVEEKPSSRGNSTALPLIEKLRPDVIAKEGYPLERWPEGQYVISYGGQALELPRLEGFSSTKIINRRKTRPE